MFVCVREIQAYLLTQVPDMLLPQSWWADGYIEHELHRECSLEGLEELGTNLVLYFLQFSLVSLVNVPILLAFFLPIHCVYNSPAKAQSFKKPHTKESWAYCF